MALITIFDFEYKMVNSLKKSEKLFFALNEIVTAAGFLGG